MPNKVLVVANETIGGRKLLDAVRERHAAGDAVFHLVVPRTRPRHGNVIYDEAVRDAAQVRVDLALGLVSGEGMTATGEVGDDDPFTATLDAAAAFDPDEIIVSTHPHTVSGWLRRGLVERIEQEAGVPVTHVVTDLDREGLPFTVTLVVANRTAVSDALLDTLKAKAEEDPARLFIVVIPQEGGEGTAAGIARQRLNQALTRLRGAGLLAAGMIGDPDPYDAAMNALQFYRVDEVVISTLPEKSSRWQRGNLIDRVARGSNVPVQHVEAADRSAVEA